MGNAPRLGCDQTHAGPRPNARHQEWEPPWARAGEYRETAGEHCDVLEASGTRARGDLGENGRAALEGARILEAFHIDPQVPDIFAEIRVRLGD